MIDTNVLAKAKQSSLENPAICFVVLTYTYNYKDEGPIEEWMITASGVELPLEEQMFNIKIAHIFKNGEMLV